MSPDQILGTWGHDDANAPTTAATDISRSATSHPSPNWDWEGGLEGKYRAEAAGDGPGSDLGGHEDKLELLRVEGLALRVRVRVNG
jgi:hypothetical protein